MVDEISEEDSKAIEFVARMEVGTKYMNRMPMKYSADIFSEALYYLSQVSDEAVAQAYHVRYGGY